MQRERPRTSLLPGATVLFSLGANKCVIWQRTPRSQRAGKRYWDQPTGGAKMKTKKEAGWQTGGTVGLGGATGLGRKLQLDLGYFADGDFKSRERQRGKKGREAAPTPHLHQPAYQPLARPLLPPLLKQCQCHHPPRPLQENGLLPTYTGLPRVDFCCHSCHSCHRPQRSLKS